MCQHFLNLYNGFVKHSAKSEIGCINDYYIVAQPRPSILSLFNNSDQT